MAPTILYTVCVLGALGPADHFSVYGHGVLVPGPPLDVVRIPGGLAHGQGYPIPPASRLHVHWIDHEGQLKLVVVFV